LTLRARSAHRFQCGVPVTEPIWFFTLGLPGIGYLCDDWTMNDQISTANKAS